jgi:5-methylcytosine-specific restriction endonuclease McrA
MHEGIRSSSELCAELRRPCSADGTAPTKSAAFDDETRRCYLCKRDLPIEAFRTITSTQRRAGRVYLYVQPSHDCRDCNREYKREQRRKRAERQGRPFEARGERTAWEAAKAERQAVRKLRRQVAWAMCRAFRALVKLSPEQAARRGVARQRERYNSDPSYQARRKAIKIRRKRALAGVAVTTVDRERVAARDGWRCGICGGLVTRETWSLDHIVPLSKGGEHTYENVQLAHLGCNSRKGNRINAQRA